MNGEVQLIVGETNATYLDLFENESISQNWRYTDLNNFQSLGAFSREFRVPHTDNNQKALGALFDVNVNSGTSNYFHYKLPAQICVDTLPIAIGYVRVRKVYQQKGGVNEIELAFYAETPDLFKTVGQKKLKDISNLSNFDEAVIYANVTDISSERIWTLIDRGQLWSEGGQAGTRRITDNAAPLYATDLTPALSWWYLLRMIVKDAGFELDAPELQTILEAYWMPWLNSSDLATDEDSWEYFFKAYSFGGFTLPANTAGNISAPLVLPFDTEEYDNNNDYNNITYSYSAPAGGRYTFEVKLAIQLSAFGFAVVGATAQLFYSVNGVETFVTQQYSYFSGGVLELYQVIGIDLNPGDTLKFIVRSATVGSSGETVNPSGTTLSVLPNTPNTSYLSLIGTRFFYGSNLIYSQNAPDMKQIDFLSDVIKMHNCVILPDRLIPNKIRIVPFENYIGTSGVKDWTSKLDLDKDIMISSTTDLQKAKTTFTYTAGEDYLSKVYKDNDRTYGEYKAENYTVNPAIEPSTFVQGETNVQLITRSTPCGLIDGTSLPIPQFISLENNFVVPGPRCLYQASGTLISLFNDDAGVMAVDPYTVPILNHYSNISPTLSDFDLNWAPEVPPYPIPGNPYLNLFNTYWRTAMNELYSPEARIMEAYFALDLTDILTFQFSDQIWIKDAMWRILEIQDYKVGDYESTRVKLIKYLDAYSDCNARPLSSNLDGTINFVDAEGEPTEATEACCIRYGYTWLPLTDKCVSGDGQRPPSSGVTGTSTNVIPRNIFGKKRTGATRSLIEGLDVTIADGNNDTLAVGDTLKLDTQVRGNAMVGKNVLISSSGFHIGGGWKLDDRTQAEGSTQHGIIMHGDETVVTINGVAYQIPIENIPNNFLVIPDESLWHCLLHVSIYDVADISNYYVGVHQVALIKTTGVAVVNTQPILISEDFVFKGGTTFGFTIDTSADSTQHRLEVTPTTGLTLPLTLRITIALQYTAVR